MKIVGVSFDKPAKNAQFKAAEKFEYDLWSDVGRELALWYEAAESADQYFADRTTVVLDPQGVWRLQYTPASISWDVASHPKKVLADMQKILGK